MDGLLHEVRTVVYHALYGNGCLTPSLIRELQVGLDELHRMREESRIRKIADHEKEKGQIAAIFDRVNDARIEFQVRSCVGIHCPVET